MTHSSRCSQMGHSPEPRHEFRDKHLILICRPDGGCSPVDISTGYENQRREHIHCAIIMDLVGHEVPIQGLEELVVITGMESDPVLETIVKEWEPIRTIRRVPILNTYVGDLSDHYVFRINRRPYLLLTCGRWEHYHSSTDTPDRLNYTKINAIADYICSLTEVVAKPDLDLVGLSQAVLGHAARLAGAPFSTLTTRTSIAAGTSIRVSC